MSSGERPIGAAKGKQSDTEALCQPPPLQTPSPLQTPPSPLAAALLPQYPQGSAASRLPLTKRVGAVTRVRLLLRGGGREMGL